MPNSPDRCQATTQKGQCPVEAVEGRIYCAYHLRDRDIENKMALKAYILTNPDIAQAAGRHSQVEELKSLREEIALCRSLIERRLNMVENNADFLAAYGAVNSAFLTLEKLITSCHKLEVSLDSLLSRTAILAIAKEVVGILMTELVEVDGYEAIVDRIGAKITILLAQPGRDVE